MFLRKFAVLKAKFHENLALQSGVVTRWDIKNKTKQNKKNRERSFNNIL